MTQQARKLTERRDDPPRPECPMCGSGRTQPFTYGGPIARVNMKCTNCGNLFHSSPRKR